jgi:hypothetical protein
VYLDDIATWRSFADADPGVISNMLSDLPRILQIAELEIAGLHAIGGESGVESLVEPLIERAAKANLDLTAWQLRLQEQFPDS